MKKLFSYTLSSLLILVSSYVTAQSLSKEDNLINLSFGVGNLVRPQGFTTLLPPTVFQYERAITEQITIGGYLGYAASTFEDEGFYTVPYSPYNSEYQKYVWNSKNILFGIKGAYHFGELLNTTKRLDPYSGISLGYNAITTSLRQKVGSSDLQPKLSPNPSSRFMFGFFIGARYYVNEKVALFGELGYSTAVLQLGISLKVK